MKRVGIFPTLVTLANGYCGVLAIYKAQEGHFRAAAFLILLAMVFDVLDGKVARIAGVTSSFGAYLDSLSDVVSFGVAPAFLAKTVVQDVEVWPAIYKPRVLAFMTIFFAMGAVLRLARYNVEHASSEGQDREGKAVASFSGIPTPGAAGVIASMVFLAYDPKALVNYQPVVAAALPIVCLLLGATMISRIPYVHFGTRFLQGRREFGYLFVLLALIGLIILFPHEMAAAGFLIYALSGLVLFPFRKRGEDEGDEDGDESGRIPVEIPEGL